MEQFDPLARHSSCDIRVLGAGNRPSDFDPPNAVDDDLVVTLMRPQVQWHADLQRKRFIGRQKKAIETKIVEADGAPAYRIEHRSKASPAKQLARQEMVSLKTGNMPE